MLNPALLRVYKLSTGLVFRPCVYQDLDILGYQDIYIIVKCESVDSILDLVDRERGLNSGACLVMNT